MAELETVESIEIGLASSNKIREWSKGEVKKPETINYRTLKPEKEGLFCEKIFGPVKDWECHCGKYKRIRYKGVVCEKCGVEVTKSKVRRERMGHIELAAPVSHIWYFKGIPSRMGLLLDMSPRELEQVLYFASYVVTDPGDTDLYEKQILSEFEYYEAREEFGDRFEAGMGAETVREMLKKIDLDKEAEMLIEDLEDARGQKRSRVTRRLEVVEAFRKANNKPEWMILDVLPVIPPELRPMVQLEGGRFATSDLNDLYRRVINRNNRLKKLLDMGAPDIITKNEKRMLQESVDALIDNGRRGRAVTGAGNRNLKSLSDNLKGKTGRFRQNLLGKRVDYSGRSVIVVGPDLKFHQCGLPKEMAVEIFKPFVMRKLVEDEVAPNIKSAKKMVERRNEKIWDALEYVIKDHPVLLNRAPTLHRLGIQAFEPVLVEGKAIKLHPLACTAYNADFDGDQMAVHLPLSTEAQAESRLLMLSTNNILAPKDGKAIAVPSQDMVLGVYYLTTPKDGEPGEGMVFNDYDEMIKAYENKDVSLQSKIKLRVKHGPKDRGKIIESSVGRFIFNKDMPQDLGFVNREEDPYGLEIDATVDKKLLGKIVDKCFRKHGNIITANVLDTLKDLGYKYSTIGALSISISDVKVPAAKTEIIEEAQEKVNEYEKLFRRGIVVNEERYNNVIRIWEEAIDEVTDALLNSLEEDNNIAIFADSGARGSTKQIRQLAGMRGLMSNASGETIEVPITANFREGLSVQEFFISTHGSRKGLSDTALRTADSGYLTRRLVDVSQDVIINMDDCGTDSYQVAKDIYVDGDIVDKMSDRVIGRYAFEDILNPRTGEIIVHKNEMINEDIAEALDENGIKEVKFRSVLECNAVHGVCAKCYGRNLATGYPVDVGEAVGIVAAQSIGEPGTQLTMRTFHSGGVAGEGITQGLPRIEELFEARKPKGLAYITEVAGTARLIENEKKVDVAVVKDDGGEEVYSIPYGATIVVADGERVEAGDVLTAGSVSPQDIMRVKGVTGVQEYIMSEVLKVYRQQGVDIDYKHIEVIIKQMISKVEISDPGDSTYLPGTMVNYREFEITNEKLENEGKKPAEGKRALLGITKASLATESWLSAASFQETTRVLTESSVEGKKDDLRGIKENVIIGKLIPAGTGMKKYKHVDVNYEGKEEEDQAQAELLESEEGQEENQDQEDKDSVKA